MFARSKRLSGPELKGLRARIAVRSPFFTLKTAPNSRKHSRFAVIVGASVDRRSTARHTLRRRATAILEDRDFGPLDVILVLSPAAGRISAREFTENLKELIKSI